jgi:hypothetical protein
MLWWILLTCAETAFKRDCLPLLLQKQRLCIAHTLAEN